MTDREILRLISRVSELESKVNLFNDVVLALQRRLERLDSCKMKQVKNEENTPIYPDF